MAEHTGIQTGIVVVLAFGWLTLNKILFASKYTCRILVRDGDSRPPPVLKVFNKHRSFSDTTLALIESQEPCGLTYLENRCNFCFALDGVLFHLFCALQYFNQASPLLLYISYCGSTLSMA